MKNTLFPITLISFGATWLLFELGWVPDFDWIVFVALIGCGIVTLALDGLTDRSVVSGPLLIASGIGWLAHFRFGVRLGVVTPLLVMLLGSLILVARSGRFAAMAAERLHAESRPPGTAAGRA